MEMSPAEPFPADKAGLHCGNQGVHRDALKRTSHSQPIRLGSIAATTAPAPSKPNSQPFPADKAGLHCGVKAAWEPATTVYAIPSR